MRWVNPLLLSTLLSGYLFLSLSSGYRATVNQENISLSLPVQIYEVSGYSYLRQLIAESLFIKTAVFYGGLKQETDQTNLEILTAHFLTISRLHPQLLDTYYRSEAILAGRNDTSTRIANQILADGRVALPLQISLPFFEGFNYFHYLDEPLRAAESLRAASEIEGAPKWIGHLASMLIAQGGNIRTGLIWLKGMYASSQDENEKKRFGESIHAFEKALQVQLALDRYYNQYGFYPKTVTTLVPAYLPEMPVWEKHYLDYNPPKLSLKVAGSEKYN